jgi:V8-like Glu-specific endopeptidase
MTKTSLQKFVQSVRQQIAQGETQLALDRLQNYLSASAPNLCNEVVLHTARYNRLRRDERKGIITWDVAQAEQYKLIKALLELLEEIPEKVSAEMSPSPVTAEAVEGLAIPEEVGLEKILGVNNLKQISWIERGIHAAQSVCRILTPEGLGTGFLITSNTLMTNNHVIPNQDIANESVAEFNYQQDFIGNQLATCRYRLNADLFRTSESLDYTIVGVLHESGKPPSERWGQLKPNPNADPVPGEHVIIIQHPNGGLKQIVLTANQVFNLKGYFLHYTTDTMPGSSGSPVFNDLWQVIAIHHAYGGLQTNSKGDKRFVNEGVLMSAIKADAGGLWPNPEP